MNHLKSSVEPLFIRIGIFLICALVGTVIFKVDLALPKLIANGTPYVVLLAISLIGRSIWSLVGLAIYFIGLLTAAHLITGDSTVTTLGGTAQGLLNAQVNQQLEEQTTMLISRFIGGLAILSTAIIGVMFLRKNAQVEDYLLKLSITDYLTGVFSRRYLFEALKQRFFDVRRYKTNNFSVILIDIDFFRKVNEEYSHLGGDLALKSLCESIQKVIRDVDMVGRYGGEEFLVLLPNTDIHGAILLAERLREAAQALVINFQGKVIPVTISAGVTDYRSFEYEHLEEMIKHADDALYLAKRSGRNQVRCSTDPALKNMVIPKKDTNKKQD